MQLYIHLCILGNIHKLYMFFLLTLQKWWEKLDIVRMINERILFNNLCVIFGVGLGTIWEVTDTSCLICIGFNTQGMQTRKLKEKTIWFSSFSDFSLTRNDGNSHDSAHSDQNFVFSQSFGIHIHRCKSFIPPDSHC